MRTVVIDAPGQIRIDTRPDPELPGPDGVVVEVVATAICGSDLHFYEGDYPLFDPVALGHEAIGTVVEKGAEVRTVEVGDLVLVSSVAGCGACIGCATRDPINCLSGPQIFGAGALGGAQADLLAVPAADFQLLKIPDGLDTEEALLLTDNLATGWAGARRADIPPGGPVVVLGLGRSACAPCAVPSPRAPARSSPSTRWRAAATGPRSAVRRRWRRPRWRPSWKPPRAAASHR